MQKNIVWVVIIVIVAGVAFTIGLNYRVPSLSDIPPDIVNAPPGQNPALSNIVPSIGTPTPDGLDALASTEGTIEHVDDTRITLRLSNGETRVVSYSSFTPVFIEPPPVPPLTPGFLVSILTGTSTPDNLVARMIVIKQDVSTSTQQQN